MKFESTFKPNRVVRLTLIVAAQFIGTLCYGQSQRPLALGMISQFEQSLTKDLNSRINGTQTIQIEAITANPGTSSNSANFLLIANAIKSSCSKSVHTYSQIQMDRNNAVDLILKADILPSRGNDFVAFVLIKNKEGLVVFSELYSIKDKIQTKPLPNLVLTSNLSIQPNLEFTYLTNQGTDTIRQKFSGSIYGFAFTGSQYARSRRDLTFGYFVALLYTLPANSNTNTLAPIINLLTGINSELLIKEFRLFNLNSNISWNSSISTDLTQLNYGRYNLSSGLGIYVTRNFSLRPGVELCNRSLLPWAPKALGLSTFDRFYIGFGLGF
jgi:hypothetical protein